MSEATTAVYKPDATIVTEFVYNETNSEKKNMVFLYNVENFHDFFSLFVSL